MNVGTIETPTDARIYSRDEQMENLRYIVANWRDLGQRPLARLVWQYANNTEHKDQFHLEESFQRQAAALRGVPLATIYNRIRRILGKIK